MKTLMIAAYFAFAVVPVAGAQTFFFAGAGPIPDPSDSSGAPGQPRVMTVSASVPNAIQDVVLTIAMNHTFVGDLRIRLSYTPTGTSTSYTAMVVNRVGASNGSSFGSNNTIDGTFAFAAGGTSFNAAASTFNLTFGVYAPFNNNFNGTFPVVEFADTFRGLPGTGTWTLTFEDGAQNDVGAVSNASIALQARPSPCLADANTDGVVNTADLVFFLGQFGKPCP